VPTREDLGQPPVHHLDLAEGADHHVGRLKVAVDDVVGVGVADGLANGLEDRQQPAAVGRCVGPLLQDRFERAPLDELHRQEGPAIGEGADLVHDGDAGVLQLAGDPRLAEEALGRERIGWVALGQQLDGDVPVEGGIAGTIDDSHAAVADLIAQFEPRRAGGRDAWGRALLAF
jgi:hypothetical protein